MLAALVFTLAAPNLPGVIFYSTANPSYNTTVVPSDPAYTPWQYEGSWGSFLGTPVGPRFFLTAAHVNGSVGQAFWFQSQGYTTVASYSLYDLALWQVDRDFPYYAPLYHGSDEVGKSLVVIGRGTQRGDEVQVGGTPKGWLWGAGDGVRRWGENQVADAGLLPGYWQILVAAFDANAGPNEAHLSTGDSGGGVFIQENSTWKLAGINWAVSGPYEFSPGGAHFNAALYEQDGLYYGSGNPATGPGVFAATRISSYQGWIEGIAVPEASPVAQMLVVAGVVAGWAARRFRRRAAQRG